MDWINNNLEHIFNIVTAIIAAAAAVTAAIPQAKEANSVIAKIRKLVDLMALNVGHAKNQIK